MIVNSRTDHSGAEIYCDVFTTIKMTQEVSEANSTIFDAGAAQAGTAMLHVPVEFANAQACKVFIVGASTEEGQELQCVEYAFSTVHNPRRSRSHAS